MANKRIKIEVAAPADDTGLTAAQREEIVERLARLVESRFVSQMAVEELPRAEAPAATARTESGEERSLPPPRAG